LVASNDISRRMGRTIIELKDDVPRRTAVCRLSGTPGIVIGCRRGGGQMPIRRIDSSFLQSNIKTDLYYPPAISCGSTASTSWSDVLANATVAAAELCKESRFSKVLQDQMETAGRKLLRRSQLGVEGESNAKCVPERISGLTSYGLTSPCVVLRRPSVWAVRFYVKVPSRGKASTQEAFPKRKLLCIGESNLTLESEVNDR